MKKNTHITKIVGLTFMFVFLISEVSGAEYRGDQYRSPVLRFLYSLFMGESGKSTQFNKTTQSGVYRYSTLRKGNSQSGASVASANIQSASPLTGLSAFHYTSENSLQSSINTSTYSLATDKADGSAIAYRSPSAGTVANTTSSVSGQAASMSSGSGISNLILSTPVSKSSGSVVAASSSSSSSDSYGSGTTVGATTPNGGGGGQQGGGGSTDTGSGGTGFSGPPADPTVATPVGDGVLALLTLSGIYLFFIRKRIGKLFCA